MRRQIVALALGVGLAGACALSSACGIDLSGTDTADDAGNDVTTADVTEIDGSNHDAASDTASPDAAPSPDAALDAALDTNVDSEAATGVDTGVACQGDLCGTTCIPTNSCATACPGRPVQCNANRTCGVDCTSCPGLPIDCAYCPAGGVTQVCVGNNTMCAVSPTTACPCADGDAGDCPAANQVCLSMGQGPGFCGTCGDPSTQGKTCGGGGGCTASTGVCQ